MIGLSAWQQNIVCTPDQSVKRLAGEYLQWLITLLIFSLAPLKPTQVSSATAPYYLGGRGRLLFSMENFPRETWFSSVLCGYFIGYCIFDIRPHSLQEARQSDFRLDPPRRLYLAHLLIEQGEHAFALFDCRRSP
jgi:hypothetical protein